MDNETAQKIWLGIAAVGGAIITEGFRRLIVPAEKVLDVELARDLEREKNITEREKDLRQALWDELEKTMGRVDLLEKKLGEATLIIQALNITNLELKATVLNLTHQLELLNNRGK
mgnify:CR=1 FL=1